MAHTPIEKLAKMNGQVDGLPHSLHFMKLLNLPCHCCHEAKSHRCYYPPASTREPENENEPMSWDMIDIGENRTTLGGHQYISIFIIRRSRYAITILHKTHEDFPSILKRAFTKASFMPKTIRCDGAGEYICQKTLQFFADNNILQ
eukprot:1068358-Rhodomonas_salina.1